MRDQTRIPCVLMRGGTSKGTYFLAEDMPPDSETRDRVLLAVMGSPEPRQVDGAGGGHPLTSKVAIVSRSARADADVDYLFAQVAVGKASVDISPTCGNILAGIGPFAIERGLVAAKDGETEVRIYMVNTDSLCIARISTPGGEVAYEGDASISGVNGTSAPVLLEFLGIEGSNCGALLPTGNLRDTIDGVDVTCIDNGMPVVMVAARDMGVTGYELPDELNRNTALKAKLEVLRLKVGPMMNLGDVSQKVVPKMTLVAPAREGGAVCTRTFIPHVCHEAIGVLGAVSVATALVMEGEVGADLSTARVDVSGRAAVSVEHPTGEFTVDLLTRRENGGIRVDRAALLRTARSLFEGDVLIPRSVWSPAATTPKPAAVAA